MTDLSPLESWFERLCDLSEVSQDTALDAIDDTGMRDQLRVLLEADRVASRILDTRAGQGASDVLAAELAREVLPERIGSFRVIRRLGSGAMGVVYEAEQDHPRRRVALKQLHPWLHSRLALDLFRFEAQALGQVSHPYIPVVYEAGQADGAAYLSMELVQGEPLLAWVHATGASLEARTELLCRVARAVHAAHQAGLVHRDLKPANILVDDAGQPKLLDFGVAAPLRSRQAGVRAGTPAYMSPEQGRGEEVGPASDIHALGTIGYQLLTGVLPVQGRDPDAVLAQKATLPTPADQLQPGIDVDVARALQKALAPRPEDRQPTAEAFASDLERALDGLPLAWVQGGPSYRLQRFVRRHRVPLYRSVLGLGVGLALAGGFSGWWRWEMARAKEAAQTRLERVQATTGALVASGRRDEAREALRAFVAAPQNAIADVSARAWVSWADLETEPELRERALAEAWLVAREPAVVDMVARGLVDAFQTHARWSELWRLRELLSERATLEARPALLEAAVARRDFEEALQLEPRPLFAQLARAIRLPLHAERAFWMDLDGGEPELLTIDVGETHVRDLLGTHVRGVIPQHGDVGWVTRDHHEMRDGVLWLSMEDHGGRLARYRLGPDGLETLEERAGLGRGRVMDFDWIDTSQGPRAVLAYAYPARSLFWYDPDEDRIETPHPPTDALGSDVMSLAVADLTGDGVDELIVGLGAWAADEVQVLTQGSAGLELLARAPTGTVAHVDVIERPDGSPVLLVSKANLEQNRDLYPEGSAYGPPGGIYLYELRTPVGEEARLERTGFLPFPVLDGVRSGPEQSAHLPLFGDFDGDGRIDASYTLQHFDLGAKDVLWVISDVLGQAESAVMVGLRSMSTHDVDGDGDDELLVSDDEAQLWVLGTGSDALPVWDAPLSTVRLPEPPTADPQVRLGWERAQQLVSIGLAREATEALARLPALATHSQARATASLVAAELAETAGEPGLASDLYAAAQEDPSTRDEALQGQLRSRLSALDYTGAAQVPAPSRPAWLEDLAPPRSWLDPADWQLERVGVLFRDPDGLRVEAFNDHGVLMRTPVEVTGPVVGIDLDVSIEHLELGAGLAVELVGGVARREVLVAFWGQGGGGRVNVYRNCASDIMHDLNRREYVVPTRLQVGALRSGPEDTLRCRVSMTGRTDLPVQPSSGVVPGRYELVVRAHGVVDYEPPTSVRAVVHRLDTLGMQPAPKTLSDDERARAALLDGRASETATGAEEAWYAIASSDEVRLREALAALWAAGDRAQLSWLLRRHGAEVVAPLVEVAGEGFAPLFLATWRHPSSRAFRTPATNAELLRPPLAALPPDREAGARLRLLRAEIQQARGELARATSLLDSVLADPPAEVALDAWLLRARMVRDEEARREAVLHALELDPSGRTRETLARTELASLLPPARR